MLLRPTKCPPYIRTCRAYKGTSAARENAISVDIYRTSERLNGAPARETLNSTCRKSREQNAV